MGIIRWFRNLLGGSPEAGEADDSGVSDAGTEADAARRSEPTFRFRGRVRGGPGAWDAARADLSEEEAPPDLAP